MWLVHENPVSPRKRLSPRNVPIAGAVLPSKYSANAGRGFSRFEYQSEPYDSVERSLRLASTSRPSSARERRPAISPRPVFKHNAVPPAPQQAGTFQRFRYSEDPFELKDEARRTDARVTASKAIGGAFTAGGNARNEKRALKRRMPELRTQLRHELRSNQPSFLRIDIDERGVLLALFNAKGMNEGRRADLHSYLNRVISTHPACAEFGLTRDPTRWGAPAPQNMSALLPADDDTGGIGAETLIYALRPPWVANDLLLAQRLQTQKVASVVVHSPS